MDSLKFCPKCGAKLEPNVKFCGSCGANLANEQLQPAGAAVEANAVQTAPTSGMPVDGGNSIPMAAAPTEAKPAAPSKAVEWIKSHVMLLAIAGCGLVAVIVAIIIICNLAKYQKIDAQDLFRFDYEGINSCGVVKGELNAYDSYYYSTDDAANALSDALSEYDLDLDEYETDGEDMLEDEISPYFALNKDKLLKAWTKAEDKSEAVKMRKALLKTNSKGEYLIKVKFDKEDELSNGDKIKCTVEYNKDYLKENKIKLTNTEFEIEVKDLEDGTALDFFKDVNVSFTGINGKGCAEVDTYSALGCISYDYDYTNSLSNGDTFTVKARYGYGDLNKAGDKFWFKYNDTYYVIGSETAEKEYKVEGLTELQEIDPFEGITFTCDRALPFLRITGVNKDSASDTIQSYVNYSVENADNLKEGDKFTVKAYASYYMEDEGYKLAGTPDADGYVTKEFTVDNSYPTYIKSDKGVAAAESFRSKIDDVIQDVRQDVKGSTYVGGLSLDGKATSITSFDKVDTYLSFNNKTNYDSFGWSEKINTLTELYKVEVKTDGDKKKDTFYVALSINDVKFGDGEYSAEGDPSARYFAKKEDFQEEVVKAEGYTVKKCSAAAASTEESTESVP